LYKLTILTIFGTFFPSLLDKNNRDKGGGGESKSTMNMRDLP